MSDGLQIAATGLAAQQARLTAVASDIANSSTPGYRRSRLSFGELVDQAGNGAGVAATSAGFSSRSGPIQDTGRPLDLALEGDDLFFSVQTADGKTALTRTGSLRLDGKGSIVTAYGALLAPPITLPAGVSESDLQIGADGTVSAGGKKLGALAIVRVANPGGLEALGDGLFAPTAASGQPAAATGKVVRQGFLEGSAVDLADAMVDMADAQRAFELSSRVIRNQDELLRIANEIRR